MEAASDYLLDLVLLRYGKLEDDYLVFSSPRRESHMALVQP